MDEVKLASTSSHECGAQEPSSQEDALLDLCNQITHLLSTRLSDNSIMVMREKLQLMQRSSYYLEIQHDDSLPSADQQHTLNMSDSTVLSLIDQRRLGQAMTLANTQVKLLLTLLGMLYEEIFRGCLDLELYIFMHKGLVSSDMAASTQERLQRIHQYLDDFESRMTRNIGPLDLQNQLILNTGHYPTPQLSASLTIKMPVMFDRYESRVASNTVHLFWEVAGQQSKEPGQEFEIQMKSLHSTDQGQFIKSIKSCKSYSIHFNNLAPDSYYEFSVKRVDTDNLVYGLWADTIVLKTLSVPK